MKASFWRWWWLLLVAVALVVLGVAVWHHREAVTAALAALGVGALAWLRRLSGVPALQSDTPTLPPAEREPDVHLLTSNPLELVAGRTYRAELVTPAGEVTAHDVATSLQALGFDCITVFDELPADWPASRREAGGASLWRVEATWRRGGLKFPGASAEGPLVAIWEHEAASCPAESPASVTPVVVDVPAPKPRTLQGVREALPPMNHQLARAAVVAGWAEARPGEVPNLAALQAIQSIGCDEGGYGRGWKDPRYPDMWDSLNWGAIQCMQGPDKATGECGPGCGRQGDSRPVKGADGKDHQVQFVWCYKKYPDDAAAAADLIRTVVQRNCTYADISSGDWDRIAYKMRLNGYFGGHFSDPKEAAAEYANWHAPTTVAIAKALGEPVAVKRTFWLPVKPGQQVPSVGAGQTGAAGVLLLLVGLALERWGRG